MHPSLVLLFSLSGLGISQAQDVSCITSTRIHPTLTLTSLGHLTQEPTGPTTVYVTQFPDLCSTGIKTKTYTITEHCPNEVECPGTGVPPGFTATVEVCTTCGEIPITATVTRPIDPAKTGAENMPPASTEDAIPPTSAGPHGCTTCGGIDVPMVTGAAISNVIKFPILEAAVGLVMVAL